VVLEQKNNFPELTREPGVAKSPGDEGRKKGKMGEFEEGFTFAQKYAASDAVAADRMLDNVSVHKSHKGVFYEFTDGSLFVSWLDKPVFVSKSELRTRLNEF
jgi:hypothetical protein